MPNGKSVDDYIARLEGWRAQVVVELRNLVKQAAPKATEAVKWGQPVFEHNGPFAYIKAFPRSVNIGFWRGAELTDPKGILEGDGNRMKHLKISDGDSVPKTAVRTFVKEAIKLNREKGNPAVARRRR